jgi:pimeloyl-ACP methyl ester carboxylesterase
MATFEHDDVTIAYEEHGSGFPVLLIAPGGMRSRIEAWEQSPWNPIEHLTPRYRVVAMDQRNAGRSSAPITGDDSWDAYTGDQLGLLDHLGIDRFAVLGMCIGGSYIANLILTAPERVAAAVLLQPIGLDANREAFHEMFDGWAADLQASRPDAAGVAPGAWSSFRDNMYGSDDFMFTVSAGDAAALATPMLILMGDDLYHPRSASLTLAGAAPNATLIESWKEGEARDRAMEEVGAFLEKHAV